MLPNSKRIAILGGGTNTYISNHLALSAPAYGTTAIQLAEIFKQHSDNKMDVDLYLTKMADPSLETNPNGPDTPQEVEALVDKLVADPDTRVIVFNVAMVDYKPTSLFTLESNAYDAYNPNYLNQNIGKYAGRLNTSKLPEVCLEMTVQDKIIQKIRKERKDILLVGFKTTCGATKKEQFEKGLKLCKDASANIVFVNDVDKDRITSINNTNHRISYNLNLLKTETDPKVIKILQERVSQLKDNQLFLQNNGLVTPEESSYWYNTRDEALDALVQMVLDRSHLHFTRSTVVDSETVPWNIPTLKRCVKDYIRIKEDTDISKGEVIQMPNPLIPETFRTVFDWVRSQGAYKLGPTGNTVGHMGVKLGPNEFLTTKRKTDFNKMEEVGLVRVITDDPDNIFGYKHFFMSEAEKEYEYWKDCLKNPNMDIQAMPPIQTGKREDKVIAFGAKPSVGGQSQRSLFETFPNLDCIVHFHCPLRTEHRDEFNTTPQFSFECGSQECIASNITGFKEYKVSDTHSVWAGHMDHHGPNIVFNKNIDPQLVINFIDKYWDLSRKTDGLSEDNI